MTDKFLQLRKQILEDEFKNLNSEQRKAVFFCDKPLLILAGAGSGKTTVIINKIGYLLKYGNAYNSTECPPNLTEDDISYLESCHKDKAKRDEPRYLSLVAVKPYNPYNLLAITFTNKAAAELKTRAEKYCGVDAANLWALTFHSTCMRMLRKYIDVFGYKSNFSIYDESDALKLIDSIIKRLGLSEKYVGRAVKIEISKAKGMYLSPAAFAESYDNKNYSHVPIIYEMYQQDLKDANALDFDDLIFLTVKLLEQHPDIAEKINRRFKYILVDEFQDTNPLQYRLVSLLAKGGIICVVGDDDQSIYRFAGATIENILNFEKSYKDAGTIRLEQNYRSTQCILSAANAVISQNTQRKGKNLWTDAGEGQKICFNHMPTQHEESDFISRTIMEEVSTNKRPYSDFCILYRTHAQSNNIEMSLKGNGIPYRIYGGLAFYKRKEVQDMLAYLNVINNPYDYTRIRRVVNEPKRGIGETTMEKAIDLAKEHGMHLFDIMRFASDFPDLARTADKLKGFADMIDGFRERADKVFVSELFMDIYEAIGYENMLKATYSNTDFQSRRENIMELLSSIKQFEIDAENPTLIGYLEQTALVNAIDNLDDKDNSVTLMTMHCAKGLEYDTVFISGFEEGLFPSQQSINEPEGIEEERRLCYVAITRAKRLLYITATHSRMLYGNVRSAMPSRFLTEIPKEFVVDKSKPQPPVMSLKAIKQKKQHHLINDAVTVIPEKNKEFDLYKKGQRVKHKMFGEGTVLEVIVMSSDSLVDVQFDKVGQKKLMSNFAKLEIIT